MLVEDDVLGIPDPEAAVASIPADAGVDYFSGRVFY